MLCNGVSTMSPQGSCNECSEQTGTEKLHVTEDIWKQQEEFGPTKVELRNGVIMPILGLGTSHSGGYSHQAVLHALKDCGYRLVDTAKRYGCEMLLGKTLRDSGVSREDIFLTTKLWPRDYGAFATKQAFYGSMERLGVEYIDLFMMHWPECMSSCSNKWQILEETWRSLELLLDEGLCRSIGVSNYDIPDLEKQLDTCSVVPFVNQVEFHPYQNPKALFEYCKENKIQFHGYSPLAKGQILKEAPVTQIAKHHNRTPAQVLIRWSIQNEVVTIPKSTNKHRVKENAQVFNFELSPEEMDLLNNLHDGRRIVDVSTLQSRIDSDLPDGYKLHFVSLVEEKSNYRNHS
ncbi:uncharacterized oxidoreductase ZK1290.5-like [Limulus polyphemus]|uniref:Uncharacterized oxidoreductase ZK1290.5-like n=1 Tax=Limulus polyphemus TaxID=6850 RepID=A0ABM1SWF9_LIMPO|nr:uncharacterized oxidoreductase ZK1290.5-like [Limulus polyphemus]XP_013780123.1 uncharacterized oxidoreductase ZK1290.5-like [Limulus polyphemus]XP_022247965.1 uncharacterized oxidoreductase ZK1290.5-like [Limulus polyphemus]